MSQASVVGTAGGSLPQRPDSDNLWKEALDSLSEEDRSKIDIQAPSLQMLSELHELTKKEIERAKQGQFTFTRKDGQKVIVKDLLAKVAKWIDHFKQVGDIAIQYDPVHAALPWAGVRFLLDIAISDVKSRELILEHATSLAEIICRYAIFQELLLRSPSTAVSELERALVMLYKNILTYLAKAKAYFEDNSLSQMERHEDLQRKLEAIKDPIVRLEKDLEEIKDELDASKRIKILRWISTEPYEKHHKLAHTDVLEGTGQWLLTDPIYLDWKNDSASSILWLHGIPGSGKTKLVSTVIEDAIEDHKKGLIPEPVYFYCSRNPAEPGRTRPRDIVASLLRQLARVSSKGPLFEPVTRAYGEEEERGFSQDSWELNQCRDLIMDLLLCHPMVTIIIDALDECDPGLRDDLLATLEQLLQNSPVLVKIFVSSRDDQDIVCHLEGYPSLELSSERNSDDIRKFIISETDRLIQRKKLLRHSSDQVGLRSLIIHKLRMGAKGMFRWVSLQLQVLCDLKTDQAIRERVGKLPASLEELYQELLIKIEHFPAQADRQYARNTLSWLLTAQRTLKTEEFLIAVSKSIGLGPETLTKVHVLGLCLNLVVFDATLDTFRFAHLSVREYLEKQTGYAKHISHALAAEVCLLSLIGSTDTQDTWSFLRRWAFTTSDLEPFKQLYSYAAIYWGVHCQKAEKNITEGSLEKLQLYFLSNEGNNMSPFCRWEYQLPDLLRKIDKWEPSLGDLHGKLHDCRGERPSPIFAACSFDFAHVLQRYCLEELAPLHIRNRDGRSCLEIILRRASWACMGILTDTHTKWVSEALSSYYLPGRCRKRLLKFLLNYKTINMEVTESILETAAEDFVYGLELVKLLLDREGHRLPITERVIKAAIKNRIDGKEILDLFIAHLGGRFQLFMTNSVVSHAVRHGNRHTVKTILSQADRNSFKIETLLKYAADSYHGIDVLSLLLETNDQVDISEDVVVESCRNVEYGRQIVELLLSSQNGVKIQATNRVLRAAVDNQLDGSSIIHLFMARGIKIRVTEEIIQYALNSGTASKETVTCLLDQYGSKMSVTEETLICAARKGGPAAVKLLLDHAEGPVSLSEHVMMAVAEKSMHLEAGLDILLRNPPVEEGALVAAATNTKPAGPTLFAALLQRRLLHIKITENMLIAAAENHENAVAVMKLLLGQCQEPFALTEEVFLTAVRNPFRGYEMIELLLEHNPVIAISERIMLVVASSGGQGLQIMKLLEARGMKVPITEELLEVACGNFSQGFEILQWLFKRYSDDVPVTDRMLQIASKCKRCILSLLLDHRKFRGAIPEKVIISAANSTRENGSLALLVERCKDQICMTENVILQATKCWSKLRMALLFQHYKDQIQVTGNILKSACRHGCMDTVDFLIRRKPDTLQINHDMVAAAAENGRSGKEILKLLQEMLSSERNAIAITADVVEAAVRNAGSLIKPRQSEEILQLLIQINKQQTRHSVTGTAIHTAACNGQMKVLELFQKELGCDVTREHFSIAALRNACRDGDSNAVRDLIAEGIYPDYPDLRGWTPLFLAVRSGRTTIVDMLLQTGLVDVNRRDADGRSPIFHAVEFRHWEVFRSLLQAKAKVDFSDKRGETPESLARKRGHYGMLRYLLARYG